MNLIKETESNEINMGNSGTSERGRGRGRVRAGSRGGSKGGSIRGGVGSRTSRRSSFTSTESFENILVSLWLK